MKNTLFKTATAGGICMITGILAAQSITHYTSTDNNFWKESKEQLQPVAAEGVSLAVTGEEKGRIFKAWGSCMNELDWDAVSLLPETVREDIFRRMYAPDGELRFNAGRIAIGASDYGRDWYSNDEVSGDFTLKYFNLDRDKTSVIPYIKSAQKYNAALKFWASPWSPPSWMKTNHYYSVRSDSRYNQMDPKSDIHLYGDQNVPEDRRVFPSKLAVNDQFIMDPRYLKAYALYFCKYIEAFKEQGIPVTRIMYQNEAYSYTNYPGCAWTPEGTIKFNVEYLAPMMRERHPEVEIYMGTFNTNRREVITKILDATRKVPNIKGVGIQWEAAQLLPELSKKYADLAFIGSESECGSGTFNWSAGEHTFHLMNHYIGNGCDEYFIWNGILADKGESHWGWRQNALIQVNSAEKTARFTPEYYAVMHYSHFVNEGAKILAFHPANAERLPILVAKGKDGKFIVVAGNLSGKEQSISVKLGKQYLNTKLPAHSFHTFVAD